MRVTRTFCVSDAEIYQSLVVPVSLMVFIWGLIWGSFFNVCIYRIPAGKSVVKPGSHCYSCGSTVKWYDNIPLLSYLALRGNCRHCGTHFSPRYFFVELLTGLLFLATFLTFGFQWQTPFHMIFISLLIIGTFTDIDHFIIPDGITLGGLVYAVVATGLLVNHSFIAHEFSLAWELWHQLSFQWNPQPPPDPLPWYIPLLYSIFSAAFGYGMLWAVGLFGKLLFRKEAMGMGDVKLFAFLGAWMGALNCIWILFLSAFVGATIGLSLLLAHHLVGKDEYETVVIPPQPTVKSQWLTAISPSGYADGTRQVTPGPDAFTDTDGSASTAVELQFSKKTSRQLHHFPYGPYIAIAAIIILLLHKFVEQGVREFFMLG
jgi:leader peptidase (prepilin peptidase)/N-methyltransferase